LLATNFGFSLPDEAVIQGVIVEIERIATVTGATDTGAGVQLLKVGVGSGDVKSVGAWSTVKGIVTYGSSSDSWNVALTGADINNTGFGVSIRARRTTGTPQVQVFRVRVTIHYLNVIGGEGISTGAAVVSAVGQGVEVVEGEANSIGIASISGVAGSIGTALSVSAGVAAVQGISATPWKSLEESMGTTWTPLSTASFGTAWTLLNPSLGTVWTPIIE